MYKFILILITLTCCSFADPSDAELTRCIEKEYSYIKVKEINTSYTNPQGVFVILFSGESRYTKDLITEVATAIIYKNNCRKVRIENLKAPLKALTLEPDSAEYVRCFSKKYPNFRITNWTEPLQFALPANKRNGTVRVYDVKNGKNRELSPTFTIKEIKCLDVKLEKW
jgi:hypothetical protein